MPSERRLPVRALGLAAALLVSALLASSYIFLLDPEVKVNRGMIERKRAWAVRSDREFSRKVVVYGGSSCAFSLDGARFEERYGWPLVNMGMEAAFGPAMLTQIALPACREGDTLVVALEPGLITRPFNPFMSAAHLAYAIGEPSLLEDPADPHGLPRLGDLLNLRPDGYRVCAMLGKAILHKPLYRYRLEEVEPSGFQWTNVRDPLGGLPDQGAHLSEETRRLFAYLRSYAAVHHLTLRYSLPWVFSFPQEAQARRLENMGLIREIQEFFPVLRDPVLGPQLDRAMFSDTSHHLSREAAQIRTDQFGEQLTHDLVWDGASLEAAGRGERTRP